VAAVGEVGERVEAPEQGAAKTSAAPAA